MNIAIILSGGVGSRMGGNVPKQYIEVCGKPVIWYCLKTFLECVIVDAVIIVVADEWKLYIERLLIGLGCEKMVLYSAPGETRQYSIYNALKVLKTNHVGCDDKIIIHDAARPLVSAQLIENCLNSCEEFDAVLPVIPVKDTLYQSTDGQHITTLLNRNELFAGQAPEAFRFSKYLALHVKMPREELLKINGSTEIAYKGGMSVKLIRGEEINFKITTHEDLSNFENIIKHRI